MLTLNKKVKLQIERKFAFFTFFFPWEKNLVSFSLLYNKNIQSWQECNPEKGNNKKRHSGKDLSGG